MSFRFPSAFARPAAAAFVAAPMRPMMSMSAFTAAAAASAARPSSLAGAAAARSAIIARPLLFQRNFGAHAAGAGAHAAHGAGAGHHGEKPGSGRIPHTDAHGNVTYGGLTLHQPKRWQRWGAQFFGGMMWFWIFYRFSCDYKVFLALEHPWDAHHGDEHGHGEGHGDKHDDKHEEKH